MPGYDRQFRTLSAEEKDRALQELKQLQREGVLQKPAEGWELKATEDPEDRPNESARPAGR